MSRHGIEMTIPQWEFFDSYEWIDDNPSISNPIFDHAELTSHQHTFSSTTGSNLQKTNVTVLAVDDALAEPGGMSVRIMHEHPVTPWP